ncbi:CD63 antigen [Halotydeus destructor]|nr:CD63 antigen [Halotydeus destructor]
MVKVKPSKRFLIDCTKRTFLAVNLAFIVLALVLSFLSVSFRNELKTMTSLIETPQHAAMAATLIGFVTIIAAIVGVIGSTNRNTSALIGYATFMVLLFVTETIILTICLFEFHDNMETRSAMRLDKLIADYGNNNQTAQLVDDIQRQFECCGSNSSDIWLDLYEKFPSSCCTNSTAVCSEADFDFPCAGKIRGQLVSLSSNVMATIITLGILHAIGLLLSLSLTKTFINQKRKVVDFQESIRMLR